MKTFEKVRIGIATLVGTGAILALCAGPAFAAGPAINQDTAQLQTGVAAADANQGNDAQIQDWAFMYASGMANVNAAAGLVNQQSNSVLLIDSASLASYDANTLQTQAGNAFASATTAGPGQQSADQAQVQGYAFQYFQGLANVNLAAGDGNQQANTVTLLIAGPDTFDTVKH